MNKPLVSCIMPTANRHEFIPFAIDNFLRQDYPNCELIIIDDGIESCSRLVPNSSKIKYNYSEPLGTIGVKRNVACEKSRGEYIVHWDDDDWYAPDWVSKQIDAIESYGADLSGLNKVIFYSYALDKSFLYENIDELNFWLCGATIAFRKSLWEQYHFVNMQIGEDTDFIKNSRGRVLAINYTEGFMAGIHGGNTSIKFPQK